MEVDVAVGMIVMFGRVARCTLTGLGSMEFFGLDSGVMSMARGVNMLVAAHQIDDKAIHVLARVSHGSKRVPACEYGDRHQNQHCPKTFEHQFLKPCLPERSRLVSRDVVLVG
jgi:hypothetical protein